MRLLVVSDSHGVDKNIKKALDLSGPVDGLIHLGDSQGSESYIQQIAKCQIFMVTGNCDFFSDHPTTAVAQLEGHRLMLTHGHLFGVSMNTSYLEDEARANQCDIVLFGHTHRPLLKDKDPDLLILNPGSISFPRQEGRKCSYMILELEKGRRGRAQIYYL